jgi:hypothetical protein
MSVLGPNPLLLSDIEQYKTQVEALQKELKIADATLEGQDRMLEAYHDFVKDSLTVQKRLRDILKYIEGLK